MAQFFRSSKVWVVDYTYDGHPRRWLKALPRHADARADIAAHLEDLYGGRARLLAVREATPEEETQYIRGDLPRNVFCPTGRAAPGRGER
ncbi:hypothetical protein RAMLITH_04465 [Ramlibacter sp. RBP-2]|uniref:Uncharacterized protein n=1 Tax=Ramlibacter lithotrophicus TaxID=2606681 RepID=A0A7X6I5H2_9BURK|nr:hypothetical protein [Ramlibacter lithotrophicus]NKE65064.1 hypothetical protein [Ramlibacter lithotrophicus]